jgi:hypothetical protein
MISISVLLTMGFFTNCLKSYSGWDKDPQQELYGATCCWAVRLRDVRQLQRIHFCLSLPIIVRLSSIWSTIIINVSIGLLHVCPNHLRRLSHLFYNGSHPNFHSKDIIPNPTFALCNHTYIITFYFLVLHRLTFSPMQRCMSYKFPFIYHKSHEHFSISCTLLGSCG